MKPDLGLMRRIMIDITNRPLSKDPPYIQYEDCDEKTINWHLVYLMGLNYLKCKVLGSSMAPDAVAILGVTPSGYEFVEKVENDTLGQKSKSQMLDVSEIIVSTIESNLGKDTLLMNRARIISGAETILAEEYPKDRRVFQKRGKTWLVVYDGIPKSVGDSVGMTYICRLLQSGGQDIHAATLRGVGIGKDNTIVFSSVGEVIDDRALCEYRERITEIDDELEEAEANNDLARKERLNEEREMLNGEIARSTGLHGRNREASSDRERHRQAVSIAIHRALKAIKKEHELLWQHLNNSLKIGEFLSYQPDQYVSWTT